MVPQIVWTMQYGEYLILDGKMVCHQIVIYVQAKPTSFVTLER